jgi:hypothetical protein
MGLEVVRADHPALQWDVVARQGVGDDALASAEILPRVPRFDGWARHAELLAVHVRL